MAERHTGVIGVFSTPQVARVAAAAAQRAGADPSVIRIAGRNDDVLPFDADIVDAEPVRVVPEQTRLPTGDMTNTLVPCTVAAGTAGALCAMPFASMQFSGIGWWGRLMIVAIVGASIGANLGFVLGARRTRYQLSHGLGITVAIDDPPPGAIEALRALQPIR